MEIVTQLDIQIKILQSLYRIEKLLGGKFPDELRKSMRPKPVVQDNIIRKELKEEPLTVDQMVQRELKRQGMT